MAVRNHSVVAFVLNTTELLTDFHPDLDILFLDRINKRLYVTHHGRLSPTKCFTLDLEHIKDFALEGINDNVKKS